MAACFYPYAGAESSTTGLNSAWPSRAADSFGRRLDPRSQTTGLKSSTETLHHSSLCSSCAAAILFSA